MLLALAVGWFGGFVLVRLGWVWFCLVRLCFLCLLKLVWLGLCFFDLVVVGSVGRFG